jgi:hypothetical protein
MEYRHITNFRYATGVSNTNPELLLDTPQSKQAVPGSVESGTDVQIDPYERKQGLAMFSHT